MLLTYERQLVDKAQALISDAATDPARREALTAALATFRRGYTRAAYDTLYNVVHGSVG